MHRHLQQPHHRDQLRKHYNGNITSNNEMMKRKKRRLKLTSRRWSSQDHLSKFSNPRQWTIKAPPHTRPVTPTYSWIFPTGRRARRFRYIFMRRFALFWEFANVITEFVNSRWCCQHVLVQLSVPNLINVLGENLGGWICKIQFVVTYPMVLPYWQVPMGELVDEACR